MTGLMLCRSHLRIKCTHGSEARPEPGLGRKQTHRNGCALRLAHGTPAHV